MSLGTVFTVHITSSTSLSAFYLFMIFLFYLFTGLFRFQCAYTTYEHDDGAMRPLPFTAHRSLPHPVQSTFLCYALFAPINELVKGVTFRNYFGICISQTCSKWLEKKSDERRKQVGSLDFCSVHLTFILYSLGVTQ